MLNPHKNTLHPAILLLASLLIVAAAFVWQGHLGYNLADEGFLWYGAQRVLQGEVPIRDFMAYDPGRYYWSAGFMWLFGDSGIISLRISVAIFQAIGIFLGLYILGRSLSNKNIVFMIFSAAVLMLWGYPPHKLFDISLSIVSIAFLVYLLEKPSCQRCFLTGIGVGFIAFFGRNHALYASIGSVGAIAYLYFNRHNPLLLIRNGFLWGVGVVVGCIPFLIFFMMKPGAAWAFWESILFLFEYKNTNLPLQVPWPWLASLSQPNILLYLRDVTIGLYFMAIMAYGILSLLYVVRQRIKGIDGSPLLVASALLALPYAHYAYSRADVGHLAHGIFPFLMGILFLLGQSSRNIKICGSALLLLSSCLVMLPLQPGIRSLTDGNWVSIDVAGDTLMVDSWTAGNLTLLKQLDHDYAPDGEQFIVSPFWPGAYAALERKSPVWEIYQLFPRTQAFQEAEIERIKLANPGFVLILDVPLDNRDDLRFKNTHPLMDQYIGDHFEPVLDKSPDKSLKIYRRK